MSVSLVRRHSPGYNFVGDPHTGMTFRWGITPEEDPDAAPWPEMADISITNRCDEGCAYCYRDSLPEGRELRLEEYAMLLRQLRSPAWGSVFQVALGGGEPLRHPDFVRILEMTRDAGIVPNYTTNGRHFTPDIVRATAEYCGAVAVSHDPTRSCPEPGELHRLGRELAEAGIKTNIHWVLSRWSLPQALELLSGRRDELLESFNAILFLAYKPAGRAAPDGTLQAGPELDRFVELITAGQPRTRLRLGVDACLSPLLLKHGLESPEYLDSCEAGFFSVFIDEELQVAPCSFCNDETYRFSLREHSFEEIWSEKLAPYRAYAGGKCAEQSVCSAGCRGPCPFYPQLSLCSGSTPSENPL